MTILTCDVCVSVVITDIGGEGEAKHAPNCASYQQVHVRYAISPRWSHSTHFTAEMHHEMHTPARPHSWDCHGPPISYLEG